MDHREKGVFDEMMADQYQKWLYENDPAYRELVDSAERRAFKEKQAERFNSFMVTLLYFILLCFFGGVVVTTAIVLIGME